MSALVCIVSEVICTGAAVQGCIQLRSTPRALRSECHMRCHHAHSSLLCCCLQHCLSKAEGSSNMHNLGQLLTCLHMADTAEHSLQITTRGCQCSEASSSMFGCQNDASLYALNLPQRCMPWLTDAVVVKSAHRSGHGVLDSPKVDSNKAVHRQNRLTDTRKKMCYTLHPKRNP